MTGAVDLQTALGATAGASATKFSLYLPDKDRDGQPVQELEQRIGTAMTLFGEVNGGATRLPVAQGIWKPSEDGKVVREATSAVYSFIRDRESFHANLERIAVFIHAFGKHTNQGEVMVEFAGEVPERGFVSRAYFIDGFPKAGERPF